MHRRKYYQFTDLTLLTPDLYFSYVLCQGKTMKIVDESTLISELLRWQAAGSSLHRLMIINKIGKGIYVAVPCYVDGQLISCGKKHSCFQAAYSEFGYFLDKFFDINNY